MAVIVVYNPTDPQVANKVTEYHPSAHTPDFDSEPNKLTNPDLSLLIDIVPIKHWKFDGASDIVEMLQAEKDIIDAQVEEVLLFNQGTPAAPTVDAIIRVDRGSAADACLRYDETADQWKIGLFGSDVEVSDTDHNHDLVYLQDLTGVSIKTLQDVRDPMTPTDEQVLTWNNANSEWEAQTTIHEITVKDETITVTGGPFTSMNFVGAGVTATDGGGGEVDITIPGAGAHTHTEADITDLQAYLLDITGEPLSDLSDVTITAIAANEIIKWSGTAWINNTLAEAGISATGHTHVEADITDLQAYALNSAVVHNTGVESIAGVKTFSEQVNITGSQASHLLVIRNNTASGEFIEALNSDGTKAFELNSGTTNGFFRLFDGGVETIEFTGASGTTRLFLNENSAEVHIGGVVALVFNNFAATVAPTATDDSAAGYKVGSRWINVTADTEHVCLDNTATAAVWTETTAGGGGDPDQNLFESITSDSGTAVADTITDTLSILGGTGISTAVVGDVLTITNDSPNADQNLFLNVASDSGTAVADNTTDTLTIAGGTGISTAVSGDTLTVTATGGSSVVNDAVQVRRSTTFSPTTSFVDVTFNFTDVETDSAVIEHNNTNTDDVDIKVTGTYEISYDGDIDPSGVSGSATIVANGRVRIDDAGTGIAGSHAGDGSFEDGSIAGSSLFGHLSNSFFVNLTAGEKLTLQISKTEVGGIGAAFIMDNITLKVKRLK